MASLDDTQQTEMVSEPSLGNTNTALLTNITLIGDRVLVQLDQLPTHSVNEYGIISPLLKNAETDGGRPKAIPSEREHLAVGTVLALSVTASTKLKELGVIINPGDRVFVAHQATSIQYNFPLDRSLLVQPFTGLISVPHVFIEAKLS